jgi:hypothetical protein
VHCNEEKCVCVHVCIEKKEMLMVLNKEKKGRQNKTSDNIDFSNINVFEMLMCEFIKSIHWETVLEEELEQKLHN